MPHMDDPGSYPLSRNKTFLQKVGEILESNLSNEQFGSENLAEAMAMSRIQLYRKLQKLTGKNISQHIREYRLEKAMELLQGNVASVAEIAYRVGFSSPAYFNKCFHEYYGHTPGEVIKLSQKDEEELLDSMFKNKKETNPQNIFQLPRKILRFHNTGFAFSVITVMIIILIISVFIYKNYRHGSFMTMDREKSIAVLPFRNDSPDPDNQYFCNGIVEEIITNLNKIRDLQVKSGSFTEPYSNLDKDLTRIARELDVAYFLDGSVRKAGENLRISVQLTNGRTGNDLWAETYDGKYSEEIFKFQQDIALQIAGALNAVITPEEKKKITAPPTINVTAYDYILRAREEQWKFWSEGDTMALRNAERFYDKALKLSPDYALGWIWKGTVYFNLHNNSAEYFTNDYADSVVWYCNKALELDPESVYALNLKGIVYYHKGEIENAIYNYEKGVELALVQNIDEALWESWWRLGFIYFYKKDYVKGITLIRKAVQRSKKSPIDYRHLLYRLGFAYLYLGDYEQAESYFIESRNLGGRCLPLCFLYYYRGNFKKALECALNCDQDQPKIWTDYFLGNIYFQLRDYQNAVMHYRKFREDREALGLNQWDNLYREGIALQHLGFISEGSDLIQQQLTLLEKRKKLDRPDGYDYHLAAIYAHRGDQERALKYLKKYESKVLYPDWERIPFNFYQYDILFESIRDHPEFKALLRQEQEEKEAGLARVQEMEKRGGTDSYK